MPKEYVTAEANLPSDPEGREISLQITDTETKEIFDTRAILARNPDDLDEPDSLTVVKGPHENREEQWYIDVLEADVGPERIDTDLLESIIDDVEEESTVINTRSAEVKTLLRYLVETGEFHSVSEASRTIMLEYVSEHYGDLLDEYIDLKVRSERSGLTSALRDAEP